MARLLPILLLIFKAWLLVDVHKKRRPQYWYFIIFFVPFGDVIYFVMHKMKDFKWGKWFDSPPSLSQVEYQYQSTPSVNNRLAYAKALYDDGRLGDALWHFNGILETDADNLDALYGKAICLSDEKAFADSMAALQAIIEKQPSYRDFQVWTELATVQWHAGQKDACLATLQQLVRTRARLDHELALAQCLIQLGRNDEAQAVMAKALSEYDHAPSHTQRLFRRSARTMRALQRR
ncbi:MAG: tetratricopeptide repeat protein [Deltaproteobacteria bacterium]|nr:tetratricopeptide repeat protein [Deltaproteobacteria bacterium]